MDQATNKGFPKDWLIIGLNYPNIMEGIKLWIPNYRTIMVSLIMAKLYSAIMEQRMGKHKTQIQHWT